jgi:hypothetical protein
LFDRLPDLNLRPLVVTFLGYGAVMFLGGLLVGLAL